MVELEVSSADKQGKDFTQVQGPRVEVTPIRPACLLLLCVLVLHQFIYLLLTLRGTFMHFLELTY